MTATRIETVESAMAAAHVTETETVTTTDVARTAEKTAQLGAAGPHPTWVHREATLAATRADGEAEAGTMTDATRAGTETATTTVAGVEDDLAPVLAPRTADIVLVTTATVGTAGTALIALIMAEAVIATRVSLVLTLPRPLRMNGIDERSLCSSLPPACELAS